MPPVFTERTEVPLVTLNLCVMKMKRYNLGEGDLVSTVAASDGTTVETILTMIMFSARARS